MPNPISASARAVLRSSSLPVRVRSRQYEPVTAHNAISSHPDVAGPCTAALPRANDIAVG